MSHLVFALRSLGGSRSSYLGKNAYDKYTSEYVSVGFVRQRKLTVLHSKHPSSAAPFIYFIKNMLNYIIFHIKVYHSWVALVEEEKMNFKIDLFFLVIRK